MYTIQNKMLVDSNGKYVNTVTGQIFLTADIFSFEADYRQYMEAVLSNWTTHVLRLYLLNSDDETPLKDVSSYVVSGNVTYNYQQGQTHSLNLTVINNDNFWSTDPVSGNIKPRAKFRLDIGLYHKGIVYWKKCGIFVLKDVGIRAAPDQTISLQLYDKFSLFDKKIGGNIDSDFTIPVGTDLMKAIRQCVKYDKESIYDAKEVFFDGDLKGFTTPYTITKTPNTSMGDILIELANMVSYDIFYNETGNLTLRPGVDALPYNLRAVHWHYTDNKQLNYAEPTFNIDYGSMINKVTVRGAIIDGDMMSASAINKNPFSKSNVIVNPINAEVVEDKNITTDALALERAQYELEKRQIAYTKSSFKSIFIPHLNIRDVVMWTCPEFDIRYEKFIIQSLSFQLGSGFFMSADMANIKEIGING